MIRDQPREVLTSAFVRLSEQAPFYIFITFVLAYGTEKLEFEKGDLLNDTLVAARVGLVCVPSFGLLSELIGRRTMYGSASRQGLCSRFPTRVCSTPDAAAWCCWRSWSRWLFHAMQYGPQAA